MRKAMRAMAMGGVGAGEMMERDSERRRRLSVSRCLPRAYQRTTGRKIQLEMLLPAPDVVIPAGACAKAGQWNATRVLEWLCPGFWRCVY